MNVVLMKMNSGEEVICTLEDVQDGKLIVTKPFGITVNADTGQGLMLYPWSIATMKRDNKVELFVNESAITFYTNVLPEDLISSYQQMVSDIIIPTKEEKKLILG